MEVIRGRSNNFKTIRITLMIIVINVPPDSCSSILLIFVSFVSQYRYSQMFIPSHDAMPFGFTHVSICANTTLIFLKDKRTTVIRYFIFILKTIKQSVFGTNYNIKFNIRTIGTNKLIQSFL